MLPVALTCPLWWVARWASRLLAGFALTAGLTAGVAAPDHPTGPAAVAAPRALPPPTWESSDCCVMSVRAATTDAAPALRVAALDVVPAVRVAAGAAPALRGAAVVASTVRLATDAAPGWSGVDVPSAAGAPHAGAGRLAPGPQARPVAGRLPATSGARAPPLG